MTRKLRKVCQCPVQFALELLGGKWTSLVLLTLAAGPARFGQLRGQLPHLSDKVLTERLRELENRGLLVRTQCRISGRFPLYQLTPRGRSLLPIIGALATWGAAAAQDLGVSIVLPGPPPCVRLKVGEAGPDAP